MEHELDENVYLDSDLIAAFKCVKCGGSVCKDGVFKKLKDYGVICLDCGLNKLED